MTSARERLADVPGARTAARLVRRGHAAALVGRARVRKLPTIVTYHRVADEPADPWGICVTPKHFREHLEVFRASGREVLPVSELLAAHRAGAAPRNALAITFDDGYLDNLRIAAPMLAAAGFPAMLFVTTGTLGTGGLMWWDVLTDIVLHDRALPPHVDIAVTFGTYRVELGDPDPTASAHRWNPLTDDAPSPRHRAYVELWSILLTCDEAERQRVLAELVAALGPARLDRDRRMMTAEEVVELARATPFEIGAHTVTHSSLVRVDPRTREHELVASKATLETLLDREVDVLAYPYGHVDQDVAETARRAGYRSAVTTTGGQVGPDADPLRVCRRGILDWSADELERVLASWG